MVHYSYETIKFNPYTSAISMPGRGWHTCEFWTITYNIRGELLQNTDNVERKLTPTDVLIIKPNYPHRLVEYSEDYIQRDIYVSDEKMKTICSFLYPNLYEKLLETPAFFSVIRLNIEASELTLNSFPINTATKNNYLSSLHTSVVIHFLSLYLQTLFDKPNPPAWLLEIKKQLSSPHNMKCDLTDILSKSYYSHSYICKQFQKFYNSSPIAYFKKSKIIHSVSMLTEKKLSITEIAYELGFSSQNVYIKEFNKVFGTSPGQWRKNNLQSKSLNMTNKWGKCLKK